MQNRCTFSVRSSFPRHVPKRQSTTHLQPIAAFVALAALVVNVFTSPAQADVVYGTSGSNIVAYDTQTLASATIPTDLYFQSYGIGYGPDGNLYVVDRNVSDGIGAHEDIRIYSTTGTDLGTFSTGLNYASGGVRGDALVFDHNGNLYVTQGASSIPFIREYFAGGGSTTLPSPAGGFSS